MCGLLITGCAEAVPTSTKGDTHFDRLDLVKAAKQNKTDPNLTDLSEVLLLDTEKFHAKLDRIDIGETTVKTNYLKDGALDRVIVTLHEFRDSKSAFENDLKKSGLKTETRGNLTYFIQELDNGRIVTILREDRYISLTLDRNSPLEDIPRLIDALKFEPLT